MADHWEWTSDPEAPCAYCVGWRCAICKKHTCDDDCPGLIEMEFEAFYPDGTLIEYMYRGVHDECQKMVDDYLEDARRNPQ